MGDLLGWHFPEGSVNQILLNIDGICRRFLDANTGPCIEQPLFSKTLVYTQKTNMEPPKNTCFVLLFFSPFPLRWGGMS